MEWRQNAKCRGEDPNLFFPTEDDPNNHGTEAKIICVDCPSRIPCLDYAVKSGQDHGIWGGHGTLMRSWVAAQQRIGPVAYRAALQRAMHELDVWADEAQREALPADICRRCGAPIKAGERPLDRNGDGASCGKAATFNKGCRCIPCVWAKSDVDWRR